MWIGWAVLIGLLEVGRCSAEIIQQPSLVLQENQTALLVCHQKKGHNAMYWYRQDAGQGLELLFYFRFQEQQDIGKNLDRFRADQPQKDHFNLNISPVKPEDSGVYFCASSEPGTSPLSFGQGTRLTVLEPGQEPTLPKVTIFAPSQKEIEEKQAATLVCLATDFIPDHVNISWYLYGTRITEGVKTEEFSKYHSETKSYSLTSRLRVSKQKWQDSYNQFQCKVKFYVNDTVEVYGSVISSEGCDTERVTYQREGYIGRFVYILLILKSTLYGVFVMSLMLRKKSVQ